MTIGTPEILKRTEMSKNLWPARCVVAVDQVVFVVGLFPLRHFILLSPRDERTTQKAVKKHHVRVYRETETTNHVLRN